MIQTTYGTSGFNYCFVRCNSKAAFDELLNGNVTFAGQELIIRTRAGCLREDDKLPNDEIELAFNLMDKDIEELKEELTTSFESHNEKTPGLR